MDSPTPVVTHSFTGAPCTILPPSSFLTKSTTTSSSPIPQNVAHDHRLLCRTNAFTLPTSGLAPGHIQANLLILPLSAASSFFALCQRNPVPCPLLAYSKPDSSSEFISCLPGISGEEIVGDIDVRTDAPGYYVYKHGKKVDEVDDVKTLFKGKDAQTSGEEHVAFLIGCSFSFESRLAAENLQPRHWSSTNPNNTPMYRTNIPLLPAGVFKNPGTMVVSMRPYLTADIERVRQITGEYGSMHGEPIAWGWDAVQKIGIRDIYDVDFGGPTEVRFEEGEVPVFWGCGVTPQIAVMAAGDAIDGVVIGHKPGHMLLLDLTEERALAAETRITT